MAVNPDFQNYVEDQLSGFGPIETKKMFGGLSFYKDGLMFGLIGNDMFYLKADDVNRLDYEKLDMPAFLASPGKKGLPYHQVPVEVLEDRNALCRWAQKSYEAALRAKKK